MHNSAFEARVSPERRAVSTPACVVASRRTPHHVRREPPRYTENKTSRVSLPLNLFPSVHVHLKDGKSIPVCYVSLNDCIITRVRCKRLRNRWNANKPWWCANQTPILPLSNNNGCGVPPLTYTSANACRKYACTSFITWIERYHTLARFKFTQPNNALNTSLYTPVVHCTLHVFTTNSMGHSHRL